MSTNRFLLDEFYKKGKSNEYILFTHKNFVYSWNVLSGHRVLPICSFCENGAISYNYAGIGDMYLLHNYIDQLRLLNGKYRRFFVLCGACLLNFEEFKTTFEIQNNPGVTQLELF